MALWASNNPHVTARTPTFSVTGSTGRAFQADSLGTAVIISCDLITAGTSPYGRCLERSNGGSRLSGGAVFAQMGSTGRCAGVHDEDFVLSASACL